MRISDWSSDVCSSDLDARIVDEPGDLVVRGENIGEDSGWRACAFEELGKSERALRNVLGVPQHHDIADHELRADDAGDLIIGKVPGLDREQYAKRQRRSEEHTSELQSLMRISYAVFCLKKKKR